MHIDTVDTATATLVRHKLQVSVLQIPDGLPRWNLVRDFLYFRKEVFVDDLGWKLNHFRGIEYEQYDSLDSVYIVAHRGDRVCGGARLRRTDWLNGTGRLAYTYMIRDAHLGLLDGMPSEICFELPPRSPKIWELTRLATSHDFEITRVVLEAANDYLVRRRAQECYFLGSPAFMRMARSMKFAPRPMGPVVGNHDGRFIAFTCPVRYASERPARSSARSSASLSVAM